MARTALIVKCKRLQTEHMKALASGKDPVNPTRVYNRCERCGKIRGFMRRFGLCHICFRNLAGEGLIMGVRKSSW